MAQEWQHGQKPGSNPYSSQLKGASNKKEVDGEAIYGPSLGYGDLGYAPFLGYTPGVGYDLSLEGDRSLEGMGAQKPTRNPHPVDWNRVTISSSKEQKTSIKSLTVGMQSDRQEPVAGAMTFSEIAMPASANKTPGVQDSPTENLVSQAPASRAANNPDLEKTFQAWLSFQKSISNRTIELYNFWQQLKQQNPRTAQNIDRSAQKIYDELFNYAKQSRGLSDIDFWDKYIVWKETIIYDLMARDFEQARRIIGGETAERRQQDRQSLLNLEVATRSRRQQLDNFYGGKNDPNNSFGGIKDPQKRTQVRVIAGEIYLRVISYDSFIYDPGGGNKANQDLYQACIDAAMLLLYGEAQEIVGGSTAQRGDLNQLFYRLPQQSPPDKPNTASQQLINSRVIAIFQAITGTDSPRNRAEQRLLETLRNAILIQWNVNNAARITDTPESQSESRSTSSQNPQSQNPVERFKQRLKQKALQQLGENRGLIEAAQKKYQNSDAGALGRLRQVVEADERLKEAQDLLTIRQRTNPESWRDKNGTPVLKNQSERSERQALIDQNQANLNEIQQVRSTLLALYPASGLLGVRDVKETNSDAKLLAILNDRFENILFNISAAIERVNSGDIPLLQLEPLIQATLQQTPEAEKAAVNQYLDSARSQKNTFLLIGFLAQIGLTVAAIFTGGFVGVVMGAIAAATGIGQAAYEFEEADDLNTIAKTGEAGGNQLLADPEAARINYIMGWVNLVLAGIDLGSLAVEGAGALSSGLRGAERIVNLPGGEVLARVTPEQIRNLERSRQLQQAGNIEEASAIVAQLKQELGEATYNELQKVWDEAATVAQKIPVATTIEQLRQRIPERIGLVQSSQLSNGEVRVNYTAEVKIEYAPNASLDDIKLHIPTALDLLEIKDNENLAGKLLKQLNLWLGKRRANAYPRAFEAQKEIEKHINIIYQNAQKVASLPPNSAEAQELLSQIANYQEEIARWQDVLVNEVDRKLGVGYVAARQSTKPEGYWIRIRKGGKISTVKEGAEEAFYVTSEQYDAIQELPSNQRRTREEIFQNLPPELREQASPIKTSRTIVEKPTRVGSDYLKEYENISLGERIGSGGNKDVYAIQGRNDLAIGILRRGEIEELNTEIEVLQKVEAQGLQTIEVLGTTTHNGRPAIIMKKYAQGSKGIVRSIGGVPERVDSADISLLNHNSIDDLEKIRSILQRKKIYIDDLQFLIAKDGRVYITDPIDIEYKPTTREMDSNAGMIDLLLNAARENNKINK